MRKRRRLRRRTRRLVCRVVATAGAVLLACGICLGAWQAHAEAVVVEIGKLYTEDRRGTPAVDWEGLWEINPDIVGWIRVEGTSIDCPVVSLKNHDAAWYLSHDLWGNWSPSGCVFLGEGCESADGRLVIYGHHITGTTAAFSELAGTWSQERLNEIGACLWLTPDGTCKRLEAAFAEEVLESDLRYLETGELSCDELASWLERVRTTASASAKQEAGSLPSQAITLVTCSRALAGEPWRSATTFVGA